MRSRFSLVAPASVLVALLASGAADLAMAGEKTARGSASDPDRSLGGYDIWMTRQKGDGSWTAPVNLGPNVNSTLREVSPAVSPDGKWLYFATKDRPDGTGNEDIYVCASDSDGWGPARNLGPAVNTMWEEIGPCPFPDGKTLMFSRRDPTQKSYDLAVSVRVEDEWLEAIGIGSPLATPGEERLPSITADGKELYFCALWRAGRGSFDIWESYRDSRGSWSEPVELGPRVNSPDSDYSPGISPDGRRLFFASKRGGENFDLYVSERKEGGTWQEAVPLPAPVNTPRYTEYCPSVGPDGKTLYFASDRPRGVVTETEEE